MIGLYKEHLRVNPCVAGTVYTVPSVKENDGIITHRSLPYKSCS